MPCAWGWPLQLIICAPSAAVRAWCAPMRVLSRPVYRPHVHPFPCFFLMPTQLTDLHTTLIRMSRKFYIKTKTKTPTSTVIKQRRSSELQGVKPPLEIFFLRSLYSKFSPTTYVRSVYTRKHHPVHPWCMCVLTY